MVCFFSHCAGIWAVCQPPSPVSGRLHLEQAVLVAIGVDAPHPAPSESAGRLLLRIQLAQLHPIGGDVGQEGEVVALGHRVIQGHIIVLVDALHLHLMSRLRLLHLQGRQGDAAAAEHTCAGGVDDVAAQGADIELGAQHIPRPIVVGDALAGEQLRHGHAQVLRQRLQQGDVRKTSAAFP